MRKWVLPTIFVCCILLMPHTAAAAGDKYPAGGDNCPKADVIEPGVLQGRIDVGSDTDAFRVNVERGDTISFRFHSQTSGLEIHTDSQYYDTSVNVLNSTSSVKIESNGYYQAYVLTTTDGVVTVRAQNAGTACFTIEPNFDYLKDTDLPADWRVTASVNAAPAPEFTPASEELQERVTALESRTSSLQQQLSEKNQTISELRTSLQQKNQTISELRTALQQKNQTISELESQPATESRQNVTIDVTVAPAEGEESFVEGGQAIVRTEGDNIDAEKMSVRYNDGIYQFDSSGQVAIPLASTGTQEMTVRYGERTERVSIEVRAQGDQQEPQNRQGTGTTGADGSGFGIVGVVTALFGSVLLLHRHR